MKERSPEEGDGNETYNAIIATYRLTARGMTKLLAEEGLTQPQFTALRAIAKHGPIPMKTLSDELSVTAPNITGIVDRLEAKGHVRRIPSPEDRRTTMVELTPRGRHLQEGVTRKYILFLQRALQKFTREEEETLRNLLAKLREEMAELGA